MANLKDRLAVNTRGRFYVDATCVDCNLCRDAAPDFFRRHEDLGVSYVYRQPVTPDEIELAQEACSGCPTDSIGNNGVEETPKPAQDKLTEAVKA